MKSISAHQLFLFISRQQGNFKVARFNNIFNDILQRMRKDNINALRPKWLPFRRRHLQTHFLQWICLNLITISLKSIPKVRINNIPASVQIKAWRRPGNKPLSEPMMVALRMYICVTRPQWVNGSQYSAYNYSHFILYTPLFRNSHKIYSRGDGFSIKMPAYQYEKSHCGDKAILPLSYLQNGISCIA